MSLALKTAYLLLANTYSAPTYTDMRANKTLCEVYVDEMAHIGEKIKVMEDKPATASTDMGKLISHQSVIPQSSIR